MPYSGHLINDHKAIENESNERRNTREIRTIYIWSDNKKISSGNEIDTIIKGLS